MTTYEELTLIVNIALSIVAILTYAYKKQHPYSDKVRCYFHNLILPETDRLHLS